MRHISQWKHSHILTSSSSAVSAFVVKFLHPFLPCGQLLMSSCLFKNLSLSVFCLTVLDHILPAPALFPDSLMTSFSCRHSWGSPHLPRLWLANWVPSLSAVSAGLPSEERSCCGQTVCGCTCCRGELHCCPITQASSWAHSDDCTVDAGLPGGLIRLRQNNWTWPG